MNIDEIKAEEQGENKDNNKSSLSYMSLNWKRKHWYGLIFFNFSMTLLLVTERIGSANDWSPTANLIVMAVGLPFFATFLAIYMWIAKKEYNQYALIIKPTRFKYFEIGITASLTSFILALVALVVAYTEGWKDTNTAPIVVYTFLSFCIILGVTSSVFTSMYEFCISFDMFYHKNKEAILREYLVKEHNLKIIDEPDKDIEEEYED